MDALHKLPAMVFAALVFGVYAAAAGFLIRDAVAWVRRRPLRRTVRGRRVRVAVLALAVVGAVCIAYAYFVEPYWPEVTEVTIPCPDLTADRPVRIVHISDLHCDPKVRLEDDLPGIIADLEPDLICFTGDAVNHLDALPVFRRLMRDLVAIAPVYACRGNWDIYNTSTDKLYDRTGVRLLESESEPVQVAGGRIYLAGAPCYQARAIAAALEPVPEEACSVLLYHVPDGFPEAAARGADLCLAGHTHGGQVALPVYGALMTLSKYGKKYEAGHYRVGAMHAYVNRGIGMEGGHAPRVRFCARPEVTLIELVPTQSEPRNDE
jgi:hypothetical protein